MTVHTFHRQLDRADDPVVVAVGALRGADVTAGNPPRRDWDPWPEDGRLAKAPDVPHRDWDPWPEGGRLS